MLTKSAVKFILQGMNTKLIIGTVSALAIALVLFGMNMSYSNTEVRLRNQLTAKQKDNENELDNLKKKISQTVQVTDLQKQMLVDVVIGQAQARKGGSGSLATLVHESVPNVDVSIFKNLLNLIAGSRDSWTMRQKELLDLKREHDNVLTVAPSSWFVGGRPHIEVVIVTSGATKEAFRTGEDNDTKLK